MNNWYGPVMMKILHGRCYVDSYVKPLHEAQLPRIVVLFVYFWMQPKFPLELDWKTNAFEPWKSMLEHQSRSEQGSGAVHSAGPCIRQRSSEKLHVVGG